MSEELFPLSSQEIKIKLDHLIEIIRKMRHHQKEYFKHRGQTDLYQAKKYESEVDKFLNANP